MSRAHQPKRPTGSTRREPTGPSRREFLQKSGLAAVGGALFVAGGEGLDIQRAREQARDSRLEALSFDAHKIKIEYPAQAQERTPQIQALITEVVALQETVVAFLQDTNRFPDGMDEAKQQWWQKLQAIFPDIPDYNEDEYTHFILEDLPKRLADYGIFVKIIIVPILNRDYDTIDAIEPIVGLYEIDRSTSSVRQPKGTPLTVNQIDVRGLVSEQLSSALSTMMPMLAPGQTFYQNVIINRDPVFREELERDERVIKRSYDENGLHRLTDADIDVVLLNNSNVTAIELAWLKLTKRLVESGTLASGLDERVVDHEAGHVAYHQSEFVHEMRPAATRSATEAIQAKMNWATHDELVANIGELRGASNKLPSLHYILNLLIQETSDVQYPLSARWIVQAMVEEIAAHPEDFGIQASVGVSVGGELPLEQRIILALPELCERTEVFNNMMDAIKSRYESEFRQLDFGVEGGAAKFQRLRWDDRLTGKKSTVAGRGVAGMAVAAGLQALAKRMFSRDVQS